MEMLQLLIKIMGGVSRHIEMVVWYLNISEKAEKGT